MDLKFCLRSLIISLLTFYFCASANADDEIIKLKNNKYHTQKKIKHTKNHYYSSSPIKKLSLLPADKKEVLTRSPVWADKKIHLLGVTITPGGFLAGEGVWRSRNEQTDIGSTFSGIPLGNSSLAHMHEIRLSARQTRASVLIEGIVNDCTLLSGYYEIDFLGNGSGNSNESNSYDARMRNLYVTLDRSDWDIHFLAGQNWSLVTTTLKGITPRTEAVPPVIDPQYVVGFAWKRQGQFRVTKNWGSAFWAALSIENPQTTFGGTTWGTALPGISTEICSAPGNQTLPSSSTFSINHIPDVIGKLVYETQVSNRSLHAEGFTLYRDFYDRIEYNGNIHNTNKNTSAYGIGAGLIAQILKDILDFQGNIMAGRGIGSYASGSLPDATLGSKGQLAAIPEIFFTLGLTWHVLPTLDLYAFGSEEKESRKYFQIGSNFFGYGAPNANNTGCHIENGICTGNTNKLLQFTIGIWNKFYKGSFGELKAGMEYSYTKRVLFAGSGGGAAEPVNYSTDDNMVFASLRYYPFA